VPSIPWSLGHHTRRATADRHPEILERLAGLGWTLGAPVPSVTRLAAYGVIRRDGRVLLCRVAPGNLGVALWTLPGGGIEFGEAPEAAVVREVEEETGLLARIAGTPSIHSDTGQWPFSAEPVSYHTIRFVYPMEVFGGTERPEVGGSTDESGWFTPSETEALRLADIVERALGLEDHGL
jgi:ADP-ribose pyrophosphatase YjhB (NUDIX family)